MQTKRVLRRPAVLAKLGISKTSLYNLEKSGKFPKHFMITPRCAVWDEQEVDAYISATQATPVSLVSLPVRRVVQGKAA